VELGLPIEPFISYWPTSTGAPMHAWARSITIWRPRSGAGDLSGERRVCRCDRVGHGHRTRCPRALIGCVTIAATPLGATAGLNLYGAMRCATAAEFVRGHTRRVRLWSVSRPSDYAVVLGSGDTEDIPARAHRQGRARRILLTMRKPLRHAVSDVRFALKAAQLGGLDRRMKSVSNLLFCLRVTQPSSGVRQIMPKPAYSWIAKSRFRNISELASSTSVRRRPDTRRLRSRQSRPCSPRAFGSGNGRSADLTAFPRRSLSGTWSQRWRGTE